MDPRCRLCAKTSQNQLDILKDARLITLLDYLFQLKVSVEDKLPVTICLSCYEMVERLWQFKEQVEQAQVLLIQLSVKANKSDRNANATETVNSSQQNLNQKKSVEIAVPNKLQTVIKNVKKSSKKKKNAESDVLKEIGYINSDGSVIPNATITGWDSYPWSCSACYHSLFQVPTQLREHYATVHDNTLVRYSCMDCSKIYTKYTTFVSHVKYHRPHLKYSCDICFKWYRTAKEVDVHRTTHGEDKPHQCTTCGKKFRIHCVLMAHTRSHLPRELKNFFQCDECPKRFATKPNLMAHKRIHRGVREFTCEQCGKSFILKGNLENHMLTHNPERPFRCSLCDKTFKAMIQLKKHLSVHSGLKPYQCDTCGRNFRTRGTLKEHYRIHTGVMPFKCEYCGRSFRFKGTLTTHTRQHTGERPYSCNECQHHFADWPNYNKHMKRRHGINTSVNCRTRQDIPPTGKPYRNPPGAILAQPQNPPVVSVQTTAIVDPLDSFAADVQTGTFYPISLYPVTEELIQRI